MRRLSPAALAASALALLAAGCTVGPNYHQPSVPQAPAWKENAVPPPNPPNGTWKQAEPSDQALRGQWWTIYNDPQLNALEDKIAVSNQTLKAAIEIAQAAEAHATGRNYSLRFTSEDIRAIGLSLFIQIAREGGIR